MNTNMHENIDIVILVMHGCITPEPDGMCVSVSDDVVIAMSNSGTVKVWTLSVTEGQVSYLWVTIVTICREHPETSG